MVKTKKFENKKLVRDKVVDYIENRGIKTKYRYLSEEEYLACLKKKLIEEANEVSEETERCEIIKEIGDVYEVLEHLAEAMGVSMEEISKARIAKRNLGGSYKKRTFLEYVEVAEDHEDIEYYLKKFGEEIED